ncbi:MAG: glycosyltransferase family 2 protein [Mailhella sp.]|nr:glycosyltransferase family 2 protein [Mailhella sp.]
MQQKVRITALIITLNGERLLGPCLSSLRFCDRILIVDSFSTDATEAIAREHGAIFIQNPWPGNALQIRHGLEWLAANAPTEWVLMLDCDEMVSAELRGEILKALASPGDASAFSMPRRTWYYNRFLRHGGCYPDRLFRLFRPGSIRIDNHGAHQKFVPAGPSGKLQGDLLHFTYSSFRNQLEKLNDYADRGARDLEARGIKGGLCPALLHSAWRFMAMYILRLGLLDGKAGFLMAAHAAFYTFIKHVRIHEGDWGKARALDMGGSFGSISHEHSSKG